MNKLKALAMTTLTMAAIGVAALAASPSASAMPRDCNALLFRAQMYLDLETVAIGAGDYSRAQYYGFWVTVYQNAAEACILG